MITANGHHTVVIGSGLSGLAAARDLALAGQHVTLLESAPALGGLASSLRLLKGEPVEYFYHFIICRYDDHLVNLVHGMGLDSGLHWRHTVHPPSW